MTKRIAVVGACPYPVPQGSQVLITETARCLQEAGHEVHLVVYGYGAGKDPDGLTIHRSPNFYGAKKTNAGPSVLKPFLDISLAQTLRRVIRERDIEVVHAHNYEGLIVALAAGKSPIIYHAHNLMADELPHYFGGASWARGMGQQMDRTIPLRADVTIALHERQAHALAKARVSEDRLHVIPPSVDLDAFRHHRDIGERPAIIYTGNLDAYQNLDYMKIVHKYVMESGLDLDWVFATNDDRPIPFGRRVPTPELGDLVECLAQDAIMICPRVSWSGYPMKILNGMAAALPVIATEDAPGPIRDGETGILVLGDEPNAFAEALCGLARNPNLRRSLGEAARAYAEAHHSRAQIAKQLIATWPE